jgi:hypothetical protein
MTVYRLPFDDDGAWKFVPQGNWDDPATGAHQPYAFDFAHPVGGIVRAARGGVVAFVENHDGNVPAGDPVPGYGTAILIRHIDGRLRLTTTSNSRAPKSKKISTSCKEISLPFPVTPAIPMVPTCTSASVPFGTASTTWGLTFRFSLRTRTTCPGVLL